MFHGHTCRTLKNLGVSQKDKAFSGFLWIPNLRPLHNICIHVYIYIHIVGMNLRTVSTENTPACCGTSASTLVMFTLFVHAAISQCFSHKGVGSLLLFIVGWILKACSIFCVPGDCIPLTWFGHL